MSTIIFQTLFLAFLGGIVGGTIKFLQWMAADLTFGILFSPPTSESIWKMILISAAIGGCLGFINSISVVLKEKKRYTVWIDNDEMLIMYKVKPPHFRNGPEDDIFSRCGMCKNYNSGEGCAKYGVKYSGVGCLVTTVCDDFEFHMD